MKNKKNILKIWVMCAAVILGAAGCGKDFDAAGYVQALLDLTFQGEISGAAGFMEDASEETLMRAYRILSTGLSPRILPAGWISASLRRPGSRN